MEEFKGSFLGIGRSSLRFPYSWALGYITLLEGVVIILTLGLYVPAWSLLYALWLLQLAGNGWKVHRSIADRDPLSLELEMIGDKEEE